MCDYRHKRLCKLMVEHGIITEMQLNEVLQIEKTSEGKIAELLIEKGLIDGKSLIQVMANNIGVQYIDLERYYIDSEVAGLIDEKLARKNLLIPVKKEDEDIIVVAMADPIDVFAMDDVKLATGFDIRPAISIKEDILKAIDKYYGSQSAEQAIKDFKEQYNIENIDELDKEIFNEINNAPAVRFVNSIIKQALKSRASDIHIEPYDDKLRIRFRVDGDLQEMITPAKYTHSAIVTRIKIMGKMDIAEKRLPQDGRIKTIVDEEEIDIRISVLPTVYGEKIVMRLLDAKSFMFSKWELGFIPKNMALFNTIIKSPNGIIMVTGPTGSGKTTTLYTILRELNNISNNIITVEDPVEYSLEGINQVQVNEKTGLNFASGLRSILRQDPDIIMIGEIRDSETAQIAIRSAITGHLVLTTMHTNDTASTITRLLDMGIKPYLLSSSIVGVIAQRLVKRICQNCKSEYIPTYEEKILFDIDDKVSLYKGEGCNICNNTGYKGRIAVHEIMIVNKEIRGLIDRGASIDDVRNATVAQGMLTLKENCKQLVLEGITSIDEVLKVIYSLE